jgi:hypothetical protein
MMSSCFLPTLIITILVYFYKITFGFVINLSARINLNGFIAVG